jgi:formate dehydrogenase maturation protein FdhE
MADRATDARWRERIDRATHLAEKHPAAAQMLGFYAALARCQQSLPGVWTPPSDRSFRDALDVEWVVSTIAPFLRWLANEPSAPADLSASASTLRAISESEWRHLVDSCLTPHRFPHTPASDPSTLQRQSPALSSEGSSHPTASVPSTLQRQSPALSSESSSHPAASVPSMSFVVEAVLQPFAELTALDRATALPQSATPARCPVCGSPPVVATLREEGHGARRALVCGLCFTEWTHPRLQCPACTEQRFDALPVFTADQLPHVRVDACDSCRTFVKSIDLTKDGLAVPIVDDLASVTLDLWARDQGYVRLRTNLLQT